MTSQSTAPDNVTATSTNRRLQSPVPATENRRIARAAGLVSVLTLLSRVGGLGRDVVVGYYFGAGMAADAFFVALRVPNLLRRLVAEGAMNVAFIPVFADYAANRNRHETARAARALATVMAVILAVLTIAGMLWAPALTAAFAPGFGDQPGKLALTVGLTRVVFPYLFLIGLVSLSGGLLNAYRHFAAPALSPIFLNLAIIASAIVLAPRLAEPVYGVACGVVLGGVLQLTILQPPLWRRGVRLWPCWEPRHPAVRRVLWLLLPTVFAVATYQLSVVFNTILASVLPGGSVSYLWYATRVYEFPIGLFAVALGTAALPSFSTQAARGAYAEMTESVSFAIRLTNFVALPASVGLLCLAQPIVSVLFQRGAFGAHEVELTARALSAMVVGLWALSITRVLVPAFYALHDARTPVLTGVAALLVNICASFMLMGVVPATGRSGLADVIAHITASVSVASMQHAGLALASSIAAIVNTVLLAVILRRRLPTLRFGSLGRSLLQSGVAAAAMVWPVRSIAAGVEWNQAGGLLLKGAVLSAAMIAGVAVFALVAVLIGGEDVRRLFRAVRLSRRPDL
ncbi:MAG TPA: murein biosynthesis integral membrane protein MurJ [Candidatus Kryptonia bacterium]|nr:murein biosynthesis integral membrane protein MurJ [Candidatus Kryptonia bacterium]